MMRGIIKAGAFVALMAGSAWGQGVPVTDGSNLVQLLAQLDQMVRDGQIQSGQLETLIKTLASEEAQKASLEEILKSLIQSSGAGKLLANIEELKGLVDDPMAMIAGLAKGDFGSNGAASVRARQALEAAGLSSETMGAMSSSSSLADRNVAQSAGAAAMVSVAGQGAFDSAGRSVSRLQTLMGEIDNTTGTKAAVDLNTRVTVELGLILVEMWRLEAANAVAQGQMGVADAATIAAERKFRSMSLE